MNDQTKQAGRVRLLATARDLFTRRGIANVGVNEVTDAAGVARMTLYNNFQSKEALILAVYEELIEETLSGLGKIGLAKRTEEARVLALFDHFDAKTRGAGYRGCPFIHVSLQASEASGPIYTRIHAYKRALRDHVFGLLEENRANRADLADQIVMLLDGAATEAFLKGVSDPGSSAKRAAAALLHAKDVPGPVPRRKSRGKGD